MKAILFKLFWYKVFVHWKLKLLNFLVDFILKFYNKINTDSISHSGCGEVKERLFCCTSGLCIVHV